MIQRLIPRSISNPETSYCGECNKRVVKGYWFYWDGQPLISCYVCDECLAKAKKEEFFTHKETP